MTAGTRQRLVELVRRHLPRALLLALLAAALIIFLLPLVAYAQTAAEPPGPSSVTFSTKELVAIIGLLQTANLALVAWVLKIVGRISRLDTKVAVIEGLFVHRNDCEAHRAACPAMELAR